MPAIQSTQRPVGPTVYLGEDMDGERLALQAACCWRVAFPGPSEATEKVVSRHISGMISRMLHTTGGREIDFFSGLLRPWLLELSAHLGLKTLLHNCHSKPHGKCFPALSEAITHGNRICEDRLRVHGVLKKTGSATIHRSLDSVCLPQDVV